MAENFDTVSPAPRGPSAFKRANMAKDAVPCVQHVEEADLAEMDAVRPSHATTVVVSRKRVAVGPPGRAICIYEEQDRSCMKGDYQEGEGDLIINRSCTTRGRCVIKFPPRTRANPVRGREFSTTNERR